MMASLTAGHTGGHFQLSLPAIPDVICDLLGHKRSSDSIIFCLQKILLGLYYRQRQPPGLCCDQVPCYNFSAGQGTMLVVRVARTPHPPVASRRIAHSTTHHAKPFKHLHLIER